MSLSRIVVEQRDKEAKTLNSFLAFSLIGSLALHIGVLSLGLGKFLGKVPELAENEPIEIAIVELPNPQELASKPEKIKTDSVVANNRGTISNSGGSEGYGVASGGSPSQAKSPPAKIITAEVIKIPSTPPKQPSPRISRAISTPLQNQKIKVVPTKPVETPTKTAPSEIVTKPKPEIAPAPVPVTRAKPAEQSNSVESDRSAQVQRLNNQRLNSLLAEAKNAREQASRSEIAAQQGKIAASLRNQPRSGVGTSNGLGNSTSNELRNSGTGNSTGRGTGNGTGTNNRGTGNVTGRGTGNGTGTNNRGTGRGNNGSQSGSTVATGTRNIERQTPKAPTSNNNTNTGSSSGRLACRTCSKPKYPENARKRKLEGKAEISVDVDSKGNVTNVRLAQTSGHAELDKAAVEQARNWKFNTPNGAAQGVTAKVDFAIEGSKKSRQNRERRRQRAARKRSVASTQNTQTTAVVKTPAGQNLRSSTSNRRRRVDTLPPRQAFDRPQRRQPSVGQTRLRESLRRSPRALSPNQNRIKRSQPPTTSASQSKLRQSLRTYQQKFPNSSEP